MQIWANYAQKKLLESTKEEPLELSFAALRGRQGRLAMMALLGKGISKQLGVLQEAKDQVKADPWEVAALEKWGAIGANTASSWDFQPSEGHDWDDSQPQTTMLCAWLWSTSDLKFRSLY